MRHLSFVSLASTALMLGSSAFGPADAQPFPKPPGRQPLHPNSRPAAPVQQTGSSRLDHNTNEWFERCVAFQQRNGDERDAGTFCNNRRLRMNGVKPFGR